jgi:hypothetical protein
LSIRIEVINNQKNHIVMTKNKERKFVAEIEIKSIQAELIPAKKKGNPPKQVGQGRYSQKVRLHGVTLPELKKRLEAAEAILRTGKLPKEEGKKDAPKPTTVEQDMEIKGYQDYLNKHGVEFHPQLGLKKLKALVEEHKAAAKTDTASEPGAGEPPAEESQSGGTGEQPPTGE